MTSLTDEIRAFITLELERLLHHETAGPGNQGAGAGDNGYGDSGGYGDGGYGSADSGGDSMTPTYLTISPDGAIGADFTGKINAEGLELDAGTSSVNNVDWRAADGNIKASIQGSDTGGTALLWLLAQALGSDTAGGIQIQATGPRGNAQINLGGTEAGESITIDVGPSGTLTLLDNTLASQFLQLPVAANLKIQGGQGSIAFAAGTPATAYFDLPTPWPNRHQAFVATIAAGPAWPTGYSGSAIESPSQGVVWADIATPGDYLIDWISLGN